MIIKGYTVCVRNQIFKAFRAVPAYLINTPEVSKTAKTSVLLIGKEPLSVKKFRTHGAERALGGATPKLQIGRWVL